MNKHILRFIAAGIVCLYTVCTPYAPPDADGDLGDPVPPVYVGEEV